MASENVHSIGNSGQYQIPRNLHAEEKVIDTCLSQSDRARSLMLSMLSAKDFFSEDNRLIFDAVKSAYRDQEEVNYSTVCRYLERDELKELIKRIHDSFPNPANAHLYARDVLEASRARQALDIADSLRSSVTSGIAEEYTNAPQSAYAELHSLISNDKQSRKSERLIEDLDGIAERIHLARTNEGVKGIRTGIAPLDNAVKGLQPKRLYVFAGRPGSGKSLLCGQIALSVARQGKRVLLCSPEMGKEEYADRLSCAVAGVSAEKMEDGTLTEEEGKRVIVAASKIRDLEIFVNDRGTQTVDDVRSEVMRREPDLLIVDYMQRLTPDSRSASRYEQVSQISFDLDRIKKDFSIPVIAAAQLNRAVDSRQDKRPVMSDLRDSGTIEQDADAIGMLYRPGHYDPDADQSLIHFELEKNRHGSLWADKLYTDEGLWISDRRMGVGQ